MAAISIVLPVFNAENTISDCIRSIQNQTFKNWELIIIDDCSHDTTPTIAKYFLTDTRIKYHRNLKNLGLPASLNIGIKLSSSTYIARMDADDLMLPDRLTLQFSYMEKNKNIGVSGSAALYYCNGSYRLVQMPSKPQESSMLKFGVPFIHPTVIFRRKIFDNGMLYDEKILRAEDLDLWQRLSNLVIMGNIPEPTIIYRDVPKSIIRTINDNFRVQLKYFGLKHALINIFRIIASIIRKRLISS